MLAFLPFTPYSRLSTDAVLPPNRGVCPHTLGMGSSPGLWMNDFAVAEQCVYPLSYLSRQDAALQKWEGKKMDDGGKFWVKAAVPQRYPDLQLEKCGYFSLPATLGQSNSLSTLNPGSERAPYSSLSNAGYKFMTPFLPGADELCPYSCFGHYTFVWNLPVDKGYWY